MAGSNPSFQTPNLISVYKAKVVHKEIVRCSRDYQNVTNLWAYGILGNISGNDVLPCPSASSWAWLSTHRRRGGKDERGLLAPRYVLLAWASVHALSPLGLWQKSGHSWEHISRLPAFFFPRAMGLLNGIGRSLSCLIARWQIPEIRGKRHYEELPFCPWDCSQGLPFQLWMFRMRSWGARQHAGAIRQHCIAWPPHPQLRVGIGPTTWLWVLQWSEPGPVHVPLGLEDVCITSGTGQWLDFFHPPQWLCSC